MLVDKGVVPRVLRPAGAALPRWSSWPCRASRGRHRARRCSVSGWSAADGSPAGDAALARPGGGLGGRRPDAARPRGVVERMAHPGPPPGGRLARRHLRRPGRARTRKPRRPGVPRRVVRIPRVVADLGAGTGEGDAPARRRWCGSGAAGPAGRSRRTIVAVAALTVGFDVLTAWQGVNLGYLGLVPISPTLPIELAARRAWSAGGGSASTAPTSRRGTSSSRSRTAALLFGVIQYSTPHRRLRRGDRARAGGARRGDRLPARGPDPGRARSWPS